MQIPIDADHSTMVKFSGNCDPHYIAVRDRLYECVKKAPGIIENRLARAASVGECMWLCEVNKLQDTTMLSQGCCGSCLGTSIHGAIL
jgi:hypothetical protein